ncbi:hypothetical protein [Thalassobacter sp. 16PALIMAR09]|uniref:hypothetical protein n=1 Tax=Thalassobacter sp. 16PALIMAR09 TaxID=1225651 RepID=UPI000A822A8C|nr:hypothetical protein [Thalassobacter sp. 16PALIMAR09]
MGFPYEEASWSVVDGVMFMGWGTAMPGIYTAIAAIICVVVLFAGNRSEHARYDDHD